jgi:hypothetical protein
MDTVTLAGATADARIRFYQRRAQPRCALHLRLVTENGIPPLNLRLVIGHLSIGVP